MVFCRFSKNKKITVYEEMGHDYYTGFNYLPLFFLQAIQELDFRKSLYLLNYYYYKVYKKDVEKEFNIKVVSSALGHSQTQITNDTYIHIFEEHNARISDSLCNDLLNTATEQWQYFFVCSKPFATKLRQRAKRNPRNLVFLGFVVDNNYLFENCGARRAALRPYFLRSFIRGSRVR